MKNQSVKVFDITDDEFADTLMGLGGVKKECR